MSILGQNYRPDVSIRPPVELRRTECSSNVALMCLLIMISNYPRWPNIHQTLMFQIVFFKTTTTLMCSLLTSLNSTAVGSGVVGPAL